MREQPLHDAEHFLRRQAVLLIGFGLLPVLRHEVDSGKWIRPSLRVAMHISDRAGDDAGVEVRPLRPPRLKPIVDSPLRKFALAQSSL
jgi:hypothetical protein